MSLGSVDVQPKGNDEFQTHTHRPCSFLIIKDRLLHYDYRLPYHLMRVDDEDPFFFLF